jgi:hypothetical protein
MRRFGLFAAFALFALPSLADTINFGNRVLTDGDSAGKVVQVAGKPDRVEQIQNEFGAVTGERWEYYRDGKTITFTIVDGKIKSITETR